MKFIFWKAWCCQPLCPAAEQPPWPNAREQIRDKPKRQIQKNTTKMCLYRCAALAICSLFWRQRQYFWTNPNLSNRRKNVGKKLWKSDWVMFLVTTANSGQSGNDDHDALFCPKNQRGVYLFWFWINQIFQFLEAMQFVLLWMILYS